MGRGVTETWGSSLTPLAKYRVTLRARTVAGEAMNIRGGNGYVEEWPNARLLRDSYLGAIWEGSSNVVVLDVQRAILRDGGLPALARFMSERLALVAEPMAKPWADAVTATLGDIEDAVGRWTQAESSTRDLEARPIADALYHALAVALLLGEGQALFEQRRDAREFVVGALYAKRWLRPAAPGRATFTARDLDPLEAIVDWQPVSLQALAALNSA